MGKFLFPLENGAYDINNSERVHGAKTYNGHGVGKLDFYASPGDVVRSMTNGKVLKAGRDSSTEYTSCDILVSGDYWKPNSVDGLVIRYYHIVDFPVSVGDVVNQGDILGYVDEKQVGTTGAHLHLDFCNYVGGTYYLGKGPNLMGPRLNTEQLTYEQEQAISLWQGQHGGNSGWGRCWEVIATPAVYQDTISSGTNLDRTVYENTKGEDDNENAINAYFERTISDNFIKCTYPNTIDELNDDAHKPLRRLVQSAYGEFGTWPFAAASYAKLYRATIIGNSYINSVAENAVSLEDWLSKVYSGRPGWMGTANKGNITFSENMLSLAQAIYNNFKYPGCYGMELHSGTEEFKQAILKAMSGIPLHNGWVNYTWATTPVFAVLFNTKTNQDEGIKGQPRGGVYLMYRGVTGSMDMFNEKIFDN